MRAGCLGPSLSRKGKGSLMGISTIPYSRGKGISPREKLKSCYKGWWDGCGMQNQQMSI